MNLLAFSPAPLFGHRAVSTSALNSSPAPAKPKVEIGQKTAVTQKVGQKSSVKQTQKAKVSEPVKRREKNTEDAPLYKVMLIGDEEYDQEHTIERMCAIMEDVDEGQAASVFTQAQTAGKAMVNKYPFEHAELYVEQLLRSDPMIFSELEEEERMGSGGVN